MSKEFARLQVVHRTRNLFLCTQRSIQDIQTPSTRLAVLGSDYIYAIIKNTVKTIVIGTGVITSALFLDYEDVSKRKKVRDICPLTGKEITVLLGAVYSICNWVPIYYLWRPNIADENDSFLIELALDGNATHIVTNNIGDLKNVELKFPDLKIVTPVKLLRGE